MWWVTEYDFPSSVFHIIIQFLFLEHVVIIIVFKGDFLCSFTCVFNIFVIVFVDEMKSDSH